MLGLVRLVLIGDVHGAWDPAHDAAALAFLRPDAAIFVGDFGEEVVDIVGEIAGLQVPKAVILGNHDGWGPLYRKGGLEQVNAQLDLLGDAHVGYAAKHFVAASQTPFSVVGGRPFTDGNDSIPKLTKHLHSVSSMQESGDRIARVLRAQEKGQLTVLVGHNGPSGLGARRHDPCGKDFRPSAGDFGDKDLRAALQAARSEGHDIPLVIFGHMHQALSKNFGGGQRDMVQFDSLTGTVFLNCAVVPRHRRDPTTGALASHFVVATLEGGVVTSVENVWVAGSRESGLHAWQREPLLSSETLPGGMRQRKAFHAFDGTWRTEPSQSEAQTSGDTAAEL